MTLLRIQTGEQLSWLCLCMSLRSHVALSLPLVDWYGFYR